MGTNGYGEDGAWGAPAWGPAWGDDRETVLLSLDDLYASGDLRVVERYALEILLERPHGDAAEFIRLAQIGRASCRERV